MAHGKMKIGHALALRIARHARRHVRLRSLRKEKKRAHKEARANELVLITQGLEE
jgi:hypothetical protein